ncbi:MAG TPA: hypothetical protein VHW24_12715 [Bryobacteraceae bacterium]|nr:hypothetical protein [Bryobacteraceae bacterium]
MKSNNRGMVTMCGAVLCGALMVPAASVCGGNFDGPLVKQQLKMNPAYPMEGASVDALLRDMRASASGKASSIVGMWKTMFISRGNTGHTPSIPDGTQLDFGYRQWHSDGTELYNAGSRPPATQSFCMGVWAQTGDNTYQANHFAITYDATGVYTGTRNFIETITLSPGGTKYSGTMVINVYDAKGTQTDHLTAQVVGVRVTLDTTP